MKVMGNIFQSAALHVIRETLSGRKVKRKKKKRNNSEDQKIRGRYKKSNPLSETMKIPKDTELISKIILKVEVRRIWRL